MKFLKLLLLLSSGALIAFGWTQGIDIYANMGAILFLTSFIPNGISLIKDSLRYRAGHFNEEIIDKKLIDNIITTIEGLFILISLIAIYSEHELFKTPGMIIWFGSLSIWILSGIIVSIIADIPLKMGYGGWYISHRRRK